MLAILVVLFTFAFGGMVLIVFFGARRVEEELNERARERQEIRAQVARIPRFFVVTTQSAAPRVGPLDDAFLGQLQQYLDAEQTLADEFVLHPSVESLYRESGRKITTH